MNVHKVLRPKLAFFDNENVGQYIQACVDIKSKTPNSRLHVDLCLWIFWTKMKLYYTKLSLQIAYLLRDVSNSCNDFN